MTTTTKAPRRNVPTAYLYSVYLALGSMQATAAYFGYASHVNVSQRLRKGGYTVRRPGRRRQKKD